MNPRTSQTIRLWHSQVFTTIVLTVVILKLLCLWTLRAIQFQAARVKMYLLIVFHARVRQALWRMRQEYRSNRTPFDSATPANYQAGTFAKDQYQAGMLTRAEADILAAVSHALEETKEGNHDH